MPCAARASEAHAYSPALWPAASYPGTQSSVVETLNSGHLESIKTLRETLMAHEWELHGKRLAMRRCARQAAAVRFCGGPSKHISWVFGV